MYFFYFTFLQNGLKMTTSIHSLKAWECLAHKKLLACFVMTPSLFAVWTLSRCRGPSCSYSFLLCNCGPSFRIPAPRQCTDFSETWPLGTSWLMHLVMGLDTLQGDTFTAAACIYMVLRKLGICMGSCLSWLTQLSPEDKKLEDKWSQFILLLFSQWKLASKDSFPDE